MNKTYQYMIEEGMKVGVCKGIVPGQPMGEHSHGQAPQGFPIYFELIEHVMKKEMTFARLTGADVLTAPQGVLGVYNDRHDIPEAKRIMLVKMIAFTYPAGGSVTRKAQDLTLGLQQGEHASFWELLENRWDIFATGNKKYPYMIALDDVVMENVNHIKVEYQKIFGKPPPKL